MRRTLSALTKMVIADVKLFSDRIDLNNASPGPKSDKLLSFAQLRFVVASYLLGKDTRTTHRIDLGVGKIVEERGLDPVRAELRDVFRADRDALRRARQAPPRPPGQTVQRRRRPAHARRDAAHLKRGLASPARRPPRNQGRGTPLETAIDRVKHSTGISWDETAPSGSATSSTPDTGKLLSSRESIDAAADKLLETIRAA